MTTRPIVGFTISYVCKIDGTLHTAQINSYLTGHNPPIDVREHFTQRGDGHEVHTYCQPVFVDAAGRDMGPTFAKGTRVLMKIHEWERSWTPLRATVIGTLIDSDGNELVGFINDIGNYHLEPADRLMSIDE
jgi:hypothetical protein